MAKRVHKQCSQSRGEPARALHDSNKVGMDVTHLPDQGYGRMCLSLPVDSERPCGCQAKRKANTFKSVSMKYGPLVRERASPRLAMRAMQSEDAQ